MTDRPATARAAFELGLTRFFTGRACKRGHTAERMVSSGMCCECLNLARGRWRRDNPEKRKAQARRVKATARATNPARERARIVAWRERKQLALAGRPRPDQCEICGTEAIGRIVFDHCHAHGQFRGWICDRCNKVLGLAKDEPRLFRAMAAYLEKHDVQADHKTA